MTGHPRIYTDYGGGDHWTADRAVWLQAKVRTAGLSCGLDCSPTLSVTTAPLRRHMRQLWRCINEPYPDLSTNYTTWLLPNNALYRYHSTCTAPPLIYRKLTRFRRTSTLTWTLQNLHSHVLHDLQHVLTFCSNINHFTCPWPCTGDRFGLVVTMLVTSTKLSYVKPGYSTGIGDHLLRVYYSGIFQATQANSAWPSLRG